MEKNAKTMIFLAALNALPMAAQADDPSAKPYTASKQLTELFAGIYKKIENQNMLDRQKGFMLTHTDNILHGVKALPDDVECRDTTLSQDEMLSPDGVKINTYRFYGNVTLCHNENDIILKKTKGKKAESIDAEVTYFGDMSMLSPK
ncbi:MAG: hypothetical protein WBK77_03045 [Alphaproteobacteria bacterium]